jgi:hypothetical protein
VVPVRRKAAPSAAPELAFGKPLRKERLGIARVEREARILARGELRHDVVVRSGGRCENPGCRKVITSGGCSWDHWLGGNGRRQQQESIETTWLLCSECDYARTHNAPSAGYWNARFKTHCETHGYAFTPHITRLEALADIAKETT